MCNCIDLINQQLKDRNTRIYTPIFWDPKENLYSKQAALIVTEKIDSHKRGQPSRLIASFCPFCGKPYQDEKPGSKTVNPET
jgi:hypothetical protein